MTQNEETPVRASGADSPAGIDLAAGRRAFIRALGFGAAGAALMTAGATMPAAAQSVSDADVLNFALNFEYLGAEFYLRATTGSGLSESEVSGSGALGSVSGGRRVPFKTTIARGFAEELARDERGHVRAVRAALGGAQIARPAINLSSSFTAAARAAGLVPANGTFDPYANEDNFLQAAFIFEDVCVTALIGGTQILKGKRVIAAAAGLLGTESYHAGAIRTLLYARGFTVQANAISAARDKLDGATDLDQGLSFEGKVNIVPADNFSLAFSRSPTQVLQIAYLSPKREPGGFFPSGVNGTIK